jgi:glycosyltransferase involved in cell wall biosynthesis
MRVLHLGKYFPPVPGGIERFLDELTLAQAALGDAPTVLVHDPRAAGEEHDRGRRILRCRSHGEALFVPVCPGWPRALSQAIAQARPQLLHLHVPNPSAFWALASPAARRLPWVVHWHADIPLDAAHRGLRLAYPLYARFERALLRRADCIVATSEAYLAASTALAPHRQRCRVVPLGLADAPAPGAAPAWPAPGLRLLAVGRLSYYKGFATLLDALATVDGISLLLIGRGPGEAALRSQISQRGLGGRVLLQDAATDAEVEAAYRACDALCLPSIDRAEAFGLVLLEAMRAGRPVIASRLAGSGMREVVLDGETGLQFAPGDRASLAAALQRLRDDAAARQRWGEAGRQRFLERYRIEPVAAAISSLYRELLPAG